MGDSSAARLAFSAYVYSEPCQRLYLHLTRELTGQAQAASVEARSDTPAQALTDVSTSELTATSETDLFLDLTPTGQHLYRTQAGDTIYGITQAFGLSIQAIIDANALADPDRLALDQQFLIPIGNTASAVSFQKLGDIIPAELNAESVPVSMKEASEESNIASSEKSINYTVQPNDTLYDIAAEFEVTVAVIVELNHIVSRRHSTLNYLSSVCFEQMALSA